MSANLRIHKNSIIGNNVVIGDNVIVEPFAIINDNVKIGNNTFIGSGSIICERSEIGNSCKIFSHSIIGSAPQDLKSKDDQENKLIIGDNNYIYEFVTISKGTSKENNITQIGDNNMIMTKVHIGHDCLMGDNSVISNGADIAGHVKISNNCFIGNKSSILQWVKIGELSMINSNSSITKDLMPFFISQGTSINNNLGYIRPNLVGLKRNKYSNIQISVINSIFSIIKNTSFSDSEKSTQINLFKSQLSDQDQLNIINKVINSIENSSKYGVCYAYVGSK